MSAKSLGLVKSCLDCGVGREALGGFKAPDLLYCAANRNASPIDSPLKEKESVLKPGSQLTFNVRKSWSQLTLNCGKAGVRSVDA